MQSCSKATSRQRAKEQPDSRMLRTTSATSKHLRVLEQLLRQRLRRLQRKRRRKHRSQLRALPLTLLQTSSLRRRRKAMRPLVAAQPVQHLQGRILPRLPPSISAMRAQTKVLAMLGASALLQTGQASRERAKALLLDPRQVT